MYVYSFPLDLSSSLPSEPTNAATAGTPSALTPSSGPPKELPTSPGQQPPPHDVAKTVSPTQDAQFSVPALHLLAEVLAPLLDIVFGNDEKDRVSGCPSLTHTDLRKSVIFSPSSALHDDSLYFRKI